MKSIKYIKRINNVVYSWLPAILLFLLISGCGQQKSNPPEIVNPVLPGDRPDPTVIKIGETYWASATSNEWAPLFPIFKSEDLVNWELVTYVLSR